MAPRSWRWVIHSGASRGWIRLGLGDGRFAAAFIVPSGGDSGSIASADFNGDGHVDVALGAGGVAIVLLGRGDGTFRATPGIPVASGIGPIAAGDLDEDGHVDLIEATAPHSVAFLHGKGNGDFVLVDEWTASFYPRAVAVADLDHDGHLDVAALGGDCGGWWYDPCAVEALRGDGKGSFSGGRNVRLNSNVGGIAFGDLNGDGLTDMLVGSWGWGARDLRTFLGAGEGRFVANEPSAVWPTLGQTVGDVIISDFDGDGKNDAAFVADYAPEGPDTALALARGRRDGSFAAPRLFGVGDNPRGAVTGDLNGDGAPDILVVDGTTTLHTYLGGPGGALESGPRVPLPSAVITSLALVDLDGDCVLDVVYGTSTGIALARGHGDGRFGAAEMLTNRMARQIVVADFDGDGRGDVADGEVAEMPPQSNDERDVIVVRRGRGDGTLAAPVWIELPGQSDPINGVGLALLDADGDGRPDLVATMIGNARLSGSPVLLYLNR